MPDHFFNKLSKSITLTEADKAIFRQYIIVKKLRKRQYLLQEGKNYGWPVITYGIEYSGKKVGDGIEQKAGMQQPVYYWDPVISPCGICFYEGSAIPEWKNNLFVAALSGQQIDRLMIRNNKVVGEERLLVDINNRFRDITYMSNALYAITDDGDVYRISKK